MRNGLSCASYNKSTELYCLMNIMLMCFQIQNKQRELDALKNRNEALLLKMKEAQERYKKEEEELQVKPRPFYVERTCYIGCVTSM